MKIQITQSNGDQHVYDTETSPYKSPWLMAVAERLYKTYPVEKTAAVLLEYHDGTTLRYTRVATRKLRYLLAATWLPGVGFTEVDLDTYLKARSMVTGKRSDSVVVGEQFKGVIWYGRCEEVPGE